MSDEMRWNLRAEMTYDDQGSRDEVYSLLTTNGVYPNQIEGEGRRLIVDVPSVNTIIYMRLSEIITRFHAVESSLELTKVD